MFKRDKKVQKAYEERKKYLKENNLIDNYNFLQQKIIKKFKYKTIVENEFPYSGMKKHHLLVANRGEEYNRKTEDELLKYINKNYDYVLMNTRKNKSIKKVPHQHLLLLDKKNS